MADKTGTIIAGFVAILIGAVLVGPLQGTVTDAGVNGTAGVIVGLLPLFFGIGILAVAIKQML